MCCSANSYIYVLLCGIGCTSTTASPRHYACHIKMAFVKQKKNKFEELLMHFAEHNNMLMCTISTL